jgi:carbamoyltransferase
MVEQERFSRVKRVPGKPPLDAVEYCLKHAGLTAADVDAIAVGWDVELLGDVPEPHLSHAILGDIQWALPRSFTKTDIPSYYVRHHLAHAASAFYSSGFQEAAILVVDGSGEKESTTIAIGDRDGIRPLLSLPISRSLGFFYLAASRHAGFPGEGEGKFMGLASYGIPDQSMPMHVTEDGLRYVDELEIGAQTRPTEAQRETLRNWWSANCYPYAPAEEKKEPFAYSRFAASVQHTLEEAVLFLARRARALSGCDKLVVAGGVAQNCSANRILVESGIFAEYFIPPISHDGGVSLGAAFEVASRIETGEQRSVGSRMEHAYWGPAYDDHEIANALQSANLAYSILSEGEMCDAVAQLLVNNQIVGWFQGRAEIGPRALGARSILANPMVRANVTRINTLKGREEWRPLAPSVLEEEFDTYFQGVKSLFMNIAVQVRESVRATIPAVVHIDGSARPQAVSQNHSPLYWELIRAFRQRTGVAVVLNTSFNLWYEPMVNSPREAIATFRRGNLDALAIGRHLVHG